MFLICYVSDAWVDHNRSLREQGIVETEILLLKRKLFYNVDIGPTDSPIERNLIYEQVKYLEGS